MVVGGGGVICVARGCDRAVVSVVALVIGAAPHEWFLCQFHLEELHWVRDAGQFPFIQVIAEEPVEPLRGQRVSGHQAVRS